MTKEKTYNETAHDFMEGKLNEKAKEKTLSEKRSFKTTPIGYDRDREYNTIYYEEDVKQAIKRLKEELSVKFIYKKVKYKDFILKEFDKIFGEELIR